MVHPGKPLNVNCLELRETVFSFNAGSVGENADWGRGSKDGVKSLCLALVEIDDLHVRDIFPQACKKRDNQRDINFGWKSVEADVGQWRDG
ncbi:hypothetical protein NP233_g1002 [Leucocoprinus birnbaumii]|uniref:Uncharacterized protein n=1 Tax=Leucocoprinus birnbaumii TaxID=56174 RepID=A0AAD5W4S7_9AGAR|nr:hypothetical protein NP233_g1002 [Leucocoprinus birnbaumii]